MNQPPASIARRKQAGQATVEYVLILVMLTIAAVVPLGSGTYAGHTEGQASSLFPRNSFMGACIGAYKDYYTAHYFVLNLPFP
jgi:hypothetical protein